MAFTLAQVYKNISQLSLSTLPIIFIILNLFINVRTLPKELLGVNLKNLLK